MTDRSLNQEREFWDSKITEAKRKVQECKESAEEYRRIQERLYAVEPTSPVGGKVQRHMMDICEDMIQRSYALASSNQAEVMQLQAGRP